jgi:hypothetical protein
LNRGEFPSAVPFAKRFSRKDTWPTGQIAPMPAKTDAANNISGRAASERYYRIGDTIEYQLVDSLDNCWG